MQDDKNKQNTPNYESNAERDQDEGNMNNGTLGGNMGVIGNNEDQPESVGSKESKTESQNTDNSSNKKDGNSK